LTENRSDNQPIADLPRTWGPLRILEQIAAEASSTVYRARHTILERDVALRLFDTRDEEEQRRLLADGRAMMRTRHPNIVQVLGAEHHDGLVGVWMDLIAGQTLAAVAAQERLAGPADVAKIGQQLCAAVATINAAGLACPHLDLRNVVREPGGGIRLDYFATSADRKGLAPELSEGGDPRPSSDVYALGALLYRLATGSFPPPGDGGALPEPLALCLDRAVAANPDERFKTPGDFGNALAKVAKGPVSRVRRIAGVTIILILAVLVIVQWPSQYRLESTLYRVGDNDNMTRLAAGDPVAVGDCLALDVETTLPMYVYVFSENAAGAAVGRFPHAMADAENPLAPDVLHQVSARGEARCWPVDHAGEFSRLHILASPEPVPEFRAMYLALPQAGRSESPVVPLVEAARKLDAKAEAAIAVSYRVLELDNQSSD
jgi:hypothetical protein